MELIPGPHGPRPMELVETRANEAAGRFDLALDQRPHGESCRIAPRRLSLVGLEGHVGGNRFDEGFVENEPMPHRPFEYRRLIWLSRGSCRHHERQELQAS